MNKARNPSWLISPFFLIGLTVFSNQLFDRYIIIRALVLLIALGMYLIWNNEKWLPVNSLSLSILALVMWEIASLLWSFSITYSIKYLALTIVSFLVVVVFSKQEAEKNLKFLLILNTAIIPIYFVFAVAQMLKQGMEPYGIHALSLNKNLFSGFLLLSLPASIISIKRANRKIFKLIDTLNIAFSILFIIVLQSRAAYLSLLLFIILGLVFGIRYSIHSSPGLMMRSLKKFYLIPAMVMIGSVVYLLMIEPEIKEDFLNKINPIQYFSEVNPASITPVTQNNYESIETRKILWKSSVRLIREKPLTGFGKGNWRIAVGKYALAFLPDRIAENKSFSHAHNDYLQQLAETGLPGLLFFIVPIMVLLFYGFKSAFVGIQSFELVIITMGLSAFLIFTFFDFPFQQVEHRFMFYFQLLLLYQLLIGNGFLGLGRVVRIRTVVIWPMVVICIGISGIQLRSDYHALKTVQYEGSGTAEKALVHLDKAKNVFYNITPTNFPLDYIIGKIHMNKGAFDEAFPFVESGLRINPFEVRIINDYGMLLNYRGMRGQSLAAFRRASQLAPFFEDPKYNMAAIYYLDKNYMEAIEILESLKDGSRKQTYLNQIRQELDLE